MRTVELRGNDREAHVVNLRVGPLRVGALWRPVLPHSGPWRWMPTYRAAARRACRHLGPSQRVAASISLVGSVVFTRLFWADLLERTVATFAQATLAVVLVDGWSLAAVYVGLAAAGIAVLKGLAATQIGSRSTASLLPADLDPAPGAHRR